MALYRNIAGVTRGMGITTYAPPPVETPPIYVPPAVEVTAPTSELLSDTELLNRYNYLLGTPTSDLTTAGYSLADNQSVMLTVASGAPTVYLSFDDILRIESQLGTPGTMSQHLQGLIGPSAPLEIPVYTPPPTNGGTLPEGGTPTEGGTPPAGGVQPSTTPKNFFPFALAAGLAIVAVAGDRFLHRRQRLVFIGGVGVLFYLTAKK